MNPCRPFAADLDLLAAGVLPPDRLRAAETHLAGCTVCRARYEQTLALCADLLVAGDATGPTDVEAWPLRRRVRRAIQEGRPRETGRWLPAAAMAGALALVALVFGKAGPQSPVVPPVPISSVSPVVDDPPLTLLACERAAARSDAALDQLLARDAARPLTSGDEPLRAFPPNALAALDQNNRLP